MCGKFSQNLPKHLSFYANLRHGIDLDDFTIAKAEIWDYFLISYDDKKDLRQKNQNLFQNRGLASKPIQRLINLLCFL